MSSPVFVDAKAVQAYHDHLVSYGSHLTDTFERLRLEVDRLGASWEDPGYHIYREAFVKASDALKTYLEEIEAIKPKLKDHIDLVGDYDRLNVGGQ